MPQWQGDSKGLTLERWCVQPVDMSTVWSSASASLQRPQRCSHCSLSVVETLHLSKEYVACVIPKAAWRLWLCTSEEPAHVLSSSFQSHCLADGTYIKVLPLLLGLEAARRLARSPCICLLAILLEQKLFEPRDHV